MLRHIQQILWVSIPAIIAFSCFYPYRKKALHAMRLQSSVFREINLLFFVVSISAVLALKLWPSFYQEHTSGVWGNIILLVNRPTIDYMVNLVPFSMIVDYYKNYSIYRSAGLSNIIFNILGNIMLFIPIGGFPALLFRNTTWKHSVSTGFSIALFTEIVQYFILRNLSVDDIILNTIGSLCGFGLSIILLRNNPKIAKRLQCQEVH